MTEKTRLDRRNISVTLPGVDVAPVSPEKTTNRFGIGARFVERLGAGLPYSNVTCGHTFQDLGSVLEDPLREY